MEVRSAKHGVKHEPYRTTTVAARNARTRARVRFGCSPVGRRPRPWKNQFLSKVGLPNENGCQLWLASVDRKGYGQFRTGGRTLKAHRVSYELFVGPIPEGKLLRHTCDTPACVAPNHLVPGSNAENQRDRWERTQWK